MSSTSIDESTAGGVTLTMTAGEFLLSCAEDESGGIFDDIPTIILASVAQLEKLAGMKMAHRMIAVCDTGAAISADLALRGSSSILALLLHMNDIFVSDGGIITLTAEQALNGGVDDYASSALGLARGGRFAITGVRMAQLAQVFGLCVAPTDVTIMDSADDVLDGRETLRHATFRVHVALTDATLDAAQVLALMQLGGVLAQGVPVHDTAVNIAALARGGDAAAIAYVTAHGAHLRGDGIVSVADVAALSGLAGFEPGGHRLAVWDTAAHLAAPGAAATLAHAMIDGIFLRTAAGAVALSADRAASLFAIPGLSANNPDGSANRVTVFGGAAEIVALRAKLAAIGSALSAIVVNQDDFVSEATLARLQSVGARAAAGVTLTVRDTSAAILAAASTATQGQSIVPAAWTLTEDAVVSVADALVLARHARLWVAPYAVTVASDAVLSVAEARALGGLGGALRTGGHMLVVRDNAANLVAAIVDGTLAVAARIILRFTLAGTQSVDAAAAETLLQADNFVLTAKLTIVDKAANLLRPSLQAAIAGSAGAMDIHQMLAAPEWIDAAAATALASLRNFTDPSSYLNVAPAVTLGEAVSAMIARADIAAGTEAEPSFAHNDAADATVNIYGESGSLLSATIEQRNGFTVTAPDTRDGKAFSVTESVNGLESGPVVVLDAGTLKSAVNAAHTHFASSGAIEVDSGKYLDLYTAGNVPALDRPALVYDPSAQTVALDIPGQARLPLITLGTHAHPPSLTVSEILVKQAS